MVCVGHSHAVEMDVSCRGMAGTGTKTRTNVTMMCLVGLCATPTGELGDERGCCVLSDAFCLVVMCTAQDGNSDDDESGLCGQLAVSLHVTRWGPGKEPGLGGGRRNGGRVERKASTKAKESECGL